MTTLTMRWATSGDVSAIAALMAAAIDTLQAGFLTPAQIPASRAVMGLDTQLVDDGTYLVAEIDGAMAGCGGWSRRQTLFGGDHSTAQRDPALLDPATDAARIRAMYTHPAFARRSIGRHVLTACEGAARAAGFATAELMATLSGEPLYVACGYRAIERVAVGQGEAAVPMVRMRRSLTN
ncbi:GNAT superfamily N-acetyltransferase [Sphingomonas jinjuensis]|uniref:GNAT superfamily N-acetyltransferase n=1 Tax=Sphingomonas jinjuensis TaxID=535907 RepID=A0A840F8Q5_9SPHN|nr:GNAT family N-acetyltransferase [Sphingomonas jinjuensis]MBB4152992.1 GNAT superfamily N-acetyltransferase [Sphingomonas jinjuensis]